MTPGRCSDRVLHAPKHCVAKPAARLPPGWLPGGPGAARSPQCRANVPRARGRGRSGPGLQATAGMPAPSAPPLSPPHPYL